MPKLYINLSKPSKDKAENCTYEYPCYTSKIKYDPTYIKATKEQKTLNIKIPKYRAVYNYGIPEPTCICPDSPLFIKLKVECNLRHAAMARLCNTSTKVNKIMWVINDIRTWYDIIKNSSKAARFIDVEKTKEARRTYNNYYYHLKPFCVTFNAQGTIESIKTYESTSDATLMNLIIMFDEDRLPYSSRINGKLDNLFKLEFYQLGTNLRGNDCEWTNLADGSIISSIKESSHVCIDSRLHYNLNLTQSEWTHDDLVSLMATILNNNGLSDSFAYTTRGNKLTLVPKYFSAFVSEFEELTGLRLETVDYYAPIHLELICSD